MSLYPIAIDNYSSLPVLFDRVSPVLADDVNRLRSAIVAIQNELGTEPKGIFASVKARLDALQASIELGIVPAVNVSIADIDGYYLSENVEGALQEISSLLSVLRADFISGMIELAEDKEYPLLINSPFSGVIESFSTKSSSGTVDATLYVDGNPVDVTSNVSTLLDTVFPSTNNVFSVGSDIVLQLTNNTNAEDVHFTVNYIKNL
jgi:hypothetical protein